jgi:hypothetical protein
MGAASTIGASRQTMARLHHPEFFPQLGFRALLDPGVVRSIDEPLHVGLAGDSHEVPGQHRHHVLAGFLAGAQVDQHARDHRAVDLDLDAFHVLADQMPAAQAKG